MAMSALAPAQATGSTASCQMVRKPWALKDAGATKMHARMHALTSSMNGAGFHGIRLQVHIPGNARNHTVGVRVRAAGAKGDYLVVNLLLNSTVCRVFNSDSLLLYLVIGFVGILIMFQFL